MKKHTLALCASALTLLLAGCSTGDPSPGSGTSSAAATSAATEADKMFVTMMVPHHRQAVEMAEIILGKEGVEPQVVTLAQGVKDSQGPEIDLMLGWLEDWGLENQDTANGSGHASMDHGGEGMMSEADMTALERAEGDDATKLFLEQMVAHHEGAIDMAQSAIDDARDPGVLALAQQVIEDQTAEIATLKGLVA